MGQRAGQRIGCVRLGGAVELEQALHHMADLLLGGMAVAYHRLLDLQGRVFSHRQAGQHQRGNGGTARLAEQER